MPRFFCDDINGNTAVISGSDAVHIGRSLRMKTGDELIICSNGIDFYTKIRSISDSQVVCDVINSCKSASEPDIRLTLFQAMPKGDKLDFIIQKAVELGAYRICPVITNRCISRPDKKSYAKKLTRYNKIALEAAKQSGRGIIPEISDIISINECINALSKMDISLICYEKGGKNLKDCGLKPGLSVGILIGSEGGFDQSEVDMCKNSSIVPVSLGKRILRCETAPVCAISIIMNITGNI